LLKAQKLESKRENWTGNNQEFAASKDIEAGAKHASSGSTLTQPLSPANFSTTVAAEATETISSRNQRVNVFA